eukprot:Gregarina_sp_Pseudo_9__1410@NODE_1942_length_1240_cov_8_831807_g1800_i0_p1_GENE_NODE_1942_length_1240_cov_8_831807_g1800_i0NODE_1942_length_1240_cov_8_831807_g1800_i0_p1_ORF_typecomplete_len374_score43_80RPA_C/PF08784_11/5_5e07_NODE_1942_length_1240_cov_8_831807_g1800_i0751196
MFNFGGPSGFDSVSGGGFIPGTFNLGLSADAGNQQPSLYSPLMAATMDTFRKNCIPLKVGMIWRAFNASPNTPRIIIDGEEVGVMRIVGTLHNFQAIEDGGADKFTFDVADGTGVIRVEWLIGIKSEAKSDYEEQTFQAFQSAAESGVPFFVNVCGEINLRSVHFPRIKAHTCDRIQNPHEIFYHDLVIIDSRLASTKKENIQGLMNTQRWSLPGDMSDPSVLPAVGAPSVDPSAAFYESPGGRSQQPPITVRSIPTPQSLTPARPTPPRNQTPLRYSGAADAVSVSNAAANGVSVSMAPSAGPAGDLPQRILAFLTPMKETHQQGVHVKVITSQLGKEIPGLTVDKVRQALVVLEDAGEAYFGRNNDMWCAI